MHRRRFNFETSQIYSRDAPPHPRPPLLALIGGRCIVAIRQLSNTNNEPSFSFRRLRLANAGVRTIGAKAIAAALCANHTLETVDLSGNDFGCKADENAWESAAGLLSFGLQARCFTFVFLGGGLFACSMSVCTYGTGPLNDTSKY